MRKFVTTLVLCLALTHPAIADHGIAMHGQVKYKPGEHFSYINPDAPTGGQLKVGVVGTFDSLNPFITKGNTPAGLDLLTDSLVFERLMVRSQDEPFSLYGRIVESVEVAPDRSWIIFKIRPEAKWADGKPITAYDVEFSHATLRDKGRPNLRLFYSKVAEVKILNKRAIKFSFKPMEGHPGYDPELPLLVGLMSILPKHYLEGKDFEKTSHKPIMGSGPYRIKEFKFGHSITYERRKDYWGRNLSYNLGSNNFDTIHYDYYRDDKVAFEAFKAGEYDIRAESNPAHWINLYDFKAVKSGKVKKVTLPHSRPVGMTAFTFNTRKPIFENRLVRQALAYAFDFEWLNKNLFHGAYTRTRSYFDNTELASHGLPEGKELELLLPFKDQLPPEVFTQEYSPPATDGSGNIRPSLLKATKLLEKAGWVIEKNTLRNKKTGETFRCEIMIFRPDEQKIALAFARNLRALGVDLHIRMVDAAEYEARRMNFDYDMIINSWGHTLSPGREQSYYWGTSAAEEPGSRNYPGIKDPVVDKLCDALATATDMETLIAAARALDRVLLWGHYVIPLYHKASTYLAYWDKFGHPEFNPQVPVSTMTWWTKDVESTQG